MTPEKVVIGDYDEVTIGNCRLIHGDCREMLPSIPDDICIVSDPPYGIGYVHSGGGCGAGLQGTNRIVQGKHTAKSFKIFGDDAPFDPSHLLSYRKVLLWGANHYARRLPDGGTWLAWDKSCGRGAADSFADGEFAWTSEKTKRNVFRHLWKGIVSEKMGEGLSNPNQFTRFHPSMKPLRLMDWCLEIVGMPDVVCDPHLGSGSTGVSAALRGLKFIGIEIDKKYFDIACKRIEKAYADQALFDLMPKEPVTHQPELAFT